MTLIASNNMSMAKLFDTSTGKEVPIPELPTPMACELFVVEGEIFLLDFGENTPIMSKLVGDKWVKV